jgi:hypothetical protein
MMTAGATSSESLLPRGPTTTTSSPSPPPPTTSSHGTKSILLHRSHQIVPPALPLQHSLEPEEVIYSWELMADFLDPSTATAEPSRAVGSAGEHPTAAMRPQELLEQLAPPLSWVISNPAYHLLSLCNSKQQQQGGRWGR